MKVKFNFSRLKIYAASLLFAIIFIMPASGQSTETVPVSRQPALTHQMVNQYRTVYEYLLEIKLNEQQKHRLQNGLMQYWKLNNTEAIEQILSDVNYDGKIDELLSLRNSSQKIIVEAFRRDVNDSVSKIFIEAYDAMHPENIPSTKAKSFADLVGVWKRTDGLLAEKSYGGQPAGVSYTESETIEIIADGNFKHIKVHSHYSGNCSRTDSKTEYGKISVDGIKLVLEIQSGSEMVKDACTPFLNQKKKIKQHKESFPWAIKINPDNNNVLTLCWNTSNTTAVCFEKQ